MSADVIREKKMGGNCYEKGRKRTDETGKVPVDSKG
jgi:hypothetical protein